MRAATMTHSPFFRERDRSYLHRKPKKRMSSAQQVMALRPGMKVPLGSFMLVMAWARKTTVLPV